MGGASVVVVGDRANDICSYFARRPARTDLIVRVAQDPATEHTREVLAQDASLFASTAA
jgi:hypothetical protein